MATQSIVSQPKPEDQEPELTGDQFWAHLQSMRGTWSDMLERYGGIEKYLHDLREE